MNTWLRCMEKGWALRRYTIGIRGPRLANLGTGAALCIWCLAALHRILFLYDIPNRLRKANSCSASIIPSTPTNARNHQISVEAGSVSINTLYNLLLSAGPILDSVNAPFLFADFYPSRISKHTLTTFPKPASNEISYLQILQRQRS